MAIFTLDVGRCGDGQSGAGDREKSGNQGFRRGHPRTEASPPEKSKYLSVIRDRTSCSRRMALSCSRSPARRPLSRPRNCSVGFLAQAGKGAKGPRMTRRGGADNRTSNNGTRGGCSQRLFKTLSKMLKISVQGNEELVYYALCERLRIWFFCSSRQLVEKLRIVPVNRDALRSPSAGFNWLETRSETGFTRSVVVYGCEI